MRTIFLFLIIFSVSGVFAQVPTTLKDFFMPGSQPGESGVLPNPANCGCHDFNKGYIYNHWQGSMMAHAVVDPLFLATLAVAQQDADSSGDLCLRCHTPTGWLSGRSVPTDGSALITDDESSVNCKFCHRIVHPTQPDSNQYIENLTYSTYTWPIDSAYLEKISGHIPPTSANGMYVVDSLDGTRRGPFYITSGGNHDKLYSPFHRRAELCGTCHDVSNPVYSRNSDDTYSLNPLDSSAADFDPYTMFPVERTYSEWLNSAYNTSGGISGTPFGGTKTSVSICQDCHMPHITAGLTNSGSDRDMGIHDLTGGNTFIPLWLEANGYMTTAVRDSSISRATFMLQNAATMDVEAVGHTVTVTVYNETGHKLPSGYPEGRRMWLNVLAFNASKDTIYKSGVYDNDIGVLTHDSDIKVYEVKPGLLGTGPTFHFVLNNSIFKDNRIPPRGFSNSNFDTIQSPPVDYTYDDGHYWDVTQYTNLPEVPDSVSVILYYQTTSKEYIEFLATTDATGQGGDLHTFWNDNGKSAPVIMVQKTLNSSDIPLSVNFSGLSVSLINNHPVISWRTYSETNNLGFIVFRREEANSDYIEIDSYEKNEDLVGLGNSSEGKAYQYVDMDTKLQFGRTYFYKIADVDYDGKEDFHGPVVIVYKPANANIPGEFVLRDNYPNPFNSGTTIRFYINEKQPVAVRIYDIRGRLIREFPKFLYYAGENEIFWDSKDNFGNTVPSGMYFYSVSTRSEKKQRKMLLIK